MIDLRRTKHRLVGILTGILIVGTGPLFGFTSTQVEVVTMQVTTGGGSPQQGFDLEDVRIKHTPLQRISPVTKIGVIQGTVEGSSVAPAPQSQRVETQSPTPSPTPAPLRVRVKYRTMNGETPGHSRELSSLHTSIPAEFSIQLAPAIVDVSEGNLQYQIIAERLNSSGVVIGSATAPSEAYSNPDSWITLGVQAEAAPMITSQGGRVVLPDGNPNDGESAVDVPAGLVKSPTQVTLTEVSLGDFGILSFGGLPAPLALYRLHADPSIQGGVLVHLLYPEFMPTTDGWTLSGPRVDTNKLSLARWDGVSWRNIGGRMDTTKNLLTAQVNNPGFIGVFPMEQHMGQASAPAQKIITPHAATNQVADFQSVDSSIEIFDINGRRVRTIPASVGVWNGRDDSGKIVESGVYIYQFKQGGERVSGVIAVAK